MKWFKECLSKKKKGYVECKDCTGIMALKEAMKHDVCPACGNKTLPDYIKKQMAASGIEDGMNRIIK